MLYCSNYFKIFSHSLSLYFHNYQNKSYIFFVFQEILEFTQNLFYIFLFILGYQNVLPCGARFAMYMNWKLRRKDVFYLLKKFNQIIILALTAFNGSITDFEYFTSVIQTAFYERGNAAATTRQEDGSSPLQ